MHSIGYFNYSSYFKQIKFFFYFLFMCQHVWWTRISRNTKGQKICAALFTLLTAGLKPCAPPFKESRLSCSDLRRTEVLFLPQRVEKSQTHCECSFQREQNDLRETKRTQTLKFRMRYGRSDRLEFALPRICVSAKLLNGTKLYQPLWRIKVWMILFYVFLIFFHPLQHEWTFLPQLATLRLISSPTALEKFDCVMLSISA